ncbi:MAG: IS21 family transposase [Patescibacteria group bacterium]
MLSKRETREIREFLKNGYSISYIARQTKISLTTIYKIRAKENKSIEPIELELTIPQKLREFKDFIIQRRKQGVTNIKKLHRELQRRGYEGDYMQVYRYLKSVPKKEGKDKRLVKRYETKPGEQAQVDWGSFGKIVINGRTERLYAFVYILGYSRMKYVEFTIKQNLQTLQNCHIHAFEKLGIVKTILYDNMKTVVLKRDRESNLEPTYNSDFYDFTKHYGFEILLSHPYWPREKGKVEAFIKTLRNDFMNGMKFGRDFFSIGDLNGKVNRWLDEESNKNIHRTTGERPFIRFEEEKQYLRFPSGSNRYETTLSSIRYATKYAMVQYKCNLYSVPHQFARKKVLLIERSEHGVGIIDIYYKSRLIAIHILISGRNKWIQNEKHFKANVKKHPKVKEEIKKKKEDYKILHTTFSRSLAYYDRFLKE